MTCIHCDRPRFNTRLDCGWRECVAKTNAMTTEQLFEIREREAIEAWQKAPADAPFYIHMTPREDDR